MTVRLNSYLTRPLITILLLGFFSGLPLALTGATLATWLADTKVKIATIGLFAAVGAPYTLKFVWSPLMDSLPFPLLSKLLGRRRGWIMATQIALAIMLTLLALTNPAEQTSTTAMLAVAVAFLSASQDIVIDAFRVETLSQEEQGEGAAMVQLGYRLGMIASSAGALHLATHIGWPGTYLFMAALMASGIAVTLWAKEPAAQGEEPDTKALAQRLSTLFLPFFDFTRRQGWLPILAFVVLYKFADAFIGIVTNPFLLSIGFDKDHIANILKIYGVIATLIGTFIGGSLVIRYGTVRILFIAGFLHAITNLLYALQAHVGADVHLLAVSVAVENISGGISSAAFVAFLSNLTNRHYTATQYALLSSLAALGRTLFATPAGFAAAYLGWQRFFLLATLLAIPGLLVLWYLQKKLGISNLDTGSKTPEEKEQKPTTPNSPLRNCSIILLWLLSGVLLVSTPILGYMAVMGAFFNPDVQVSFCLLLFLGIPWSMISFLWWLVLRKKKAPGHGIRSGKESKAS